MLSLGLVNPESGATLSKYIKYAGQLEKTFNAPFVPFELLCWRHQKIKNALENWRKYYFNDDQTQRTYNCMKALEEELFVKFSRPSVKLGRRKELQLLRCMFVFLKQLWISNEAKAATSVDSVRHLKSSPIANPRLRKNQVVAKLIDNPYVKQ